MSDAEEEKIADAIGKLAALTNFPFIALELSQQCTEEQVADVFAHINSEGKKLNQSDFILTLMSVFWDQGRSELEAFCRTARQPAPAGQPSSFNQIFQPDPDHLLRVGVGVAFRRARLEHVYSLLRVGPDCRCDSRRVREVAPRRSMIAQQGARVDDGSP